MRSIIRFIRPTHIFNCLRFFLTDKPADANTPIKKQTLLIIKTEAIGDYILFRNFLKLIKESSRFQNYEITLLGNEVWKSLSLELDKEEVSNFIFINKLNFQKDSNYRKLFLENINAKGYEYAINATYSREFMLGDSIIRSVQANHKIGMFGDDASEIPVFKQLGDSFYSTLISSSNHIPFELNRNTHFFERILNHKIDLSKPNIAIQVERKFTIALLPGAQHESRRWSPAKFKQVAEHLNKNHGCSFVILGGKEDAIIATQILSEQNSDFIKSYCGELPLSELPAFMASITLAICNDSGTLHIAAAVNTPAICISNANHYGRFTPYPAAISDHLRFIYPPKFLKEFSTFSERYEATQFGSTFNIQEIEVDEVILAAENLLALK